MDLLAKDYCWQKLYKRENQLNLVFVNVRKIRNVNRKGLTLENLRYCRRITSRFKNKLNLLPSPPLWIVSGIFVTFNVDKMQWNGTIG